MDFRPLTNRAFKESAADIVGKLSGTEPTITTAAGDNLPLDNAVAAEYMGKIKDAITKELPTYTSTDANKVLAVNAQGTGIGWNTAGGGDNDYIVEFELTATNPEEWTFVSSSKTPSEIIAAFNAHKNVRGIANVSDYLNLELKLVYVEEESIGFGCLSSSYMGYEVGAMLEDDVWEWSVTVTALEELPSYDNDDENKVLTLAYAGGDDVTVQWVDVPKELPTRPTTNGTYVLKCTVTDGTAALSWVADT